MTEPLRPPPVSGMLRAPGDAPPDIGEMPAEGTVLGIPQPRADDAEDLTILGFPAVPDLPHSVDLIAGDTAADRSIPVYEDVADASVHLVTLQRADPIAGVALLLAGAAAGASLWLPWARGDADTGRSLVRRGLVVFGRGVDAVGRSGGQWEPTAIVLGGALLLLLGVLLFLPSRTHRVVGLLALCVAIAVTVAVLSRIAQAGWSTAAFDRGMWCAVAVAGLGILGALKAMLTVPRVALRARRTVPQ